LLTSAVSDKPVHVRADRLVSLVFRVGRIDSARILPEPFGRPADFALAAFWERWSAGFAASRPAVEVRLRASAEALAVFPEVFGDGIRQALDAALPPDEQGSAGDPRSLPHRREHVAPTPSRRQ
jgi:hypothetical protein